MENPCNECIVKINCTEVCPSKRNYRVLLNNAIKSYNSNSLLLVIHRKKYRFYKELSLENLVDIEEIRRRKERLTEDNETDNSNPY